MDGKITLEALAKQKEKVVNVGPVTDTGAELAAVSPKEMTLEMRKQVDQIKSGPD